MGLVERGDWTYGDTQADTRLLIAEYSREGYPADHYADAVCTCGGKVFALSLDDNEGVALRKCAACETTHPMADSDEFLEEAEPEEC